MGLYNEFGYPPHDVSSKSETEVEQALREAAENGAHAIEDANRKLVHALRAVRTIVSSRFPIEWQHDVQRVLALIDEVLPL